jgi:hypothetical protein
LFVGVATIHQELNLLQFFEILFGIQAPGSPTESVILHILSPNTLTGSTERLLTPLVYLRELYQIVFLSRNGLLKSREEGSQILIPQHDSALLPGLNLIAFTEENH